MKLILKLTINNFMEFIKKLELEFKAQTEAIRSSYEKIIYAHFDALKITDKLDEYDWQNNVDQLLEGSCGEASENDCKYEIIKTYLEYLSEEDKQFFAENWVVDYGKDYIKKILF